MEFQRVLVRSAMSKGLESATSNVYSSDLFDRGYGDAGVDFLEAGSQFDNIVTNPPYKAAEGFVRDGLKLANKKFALLLRLAFIEGSNRQRTIFREMTHSRVWVVSERITFYPEGAERTGKDEGREQ